MTNSAESRAQLRPSLFGEQMWMAAQEVEFLEAGRTLVFNPDARAYPGAFSSAKTDTYQFMAVLDPDHSYARSGQDAGDIYSAVVLAKGLTPSETEPVQLRLSKVTPARPARADTESVKLAEFVSPALSKFWGRPITMRAGVVLPPGFVAGDSKRYPAVYHVHGFGGSHLMAWTQGAAIPAMIKEGKRFEAIHVYLDASFHTGHHVFADSANNGPWGHALTKEFIPFLEEKYHLAPAPGARFLTGHSSGGWSTLWLQVAYPDFFGGTWPTSPDPVDFRSFTGVDATPGSKQNAYRTKTGEVLNLVRRGGKNIASFDEYTKQEVVEGDYGGQIASFEWVFSPKGDDGRPMKLFNRATGEQNPAVQEAWKKYDIRRVLDENWAELGPKLRGKIHLACGSEDTFHLEEAVYMLCDFLKSKGMEDSCLIVPGRDHLNLFPSHEKYPDGLLGKIDGEMGAAWSKAAVASPAKAGRRPVK